MNYQDKTGKDLIKELQELQMEHNSLKTSYEKDITERKRTEDSLRESEERYRRLLEGSPDAIAVHSEGKFVFVNPAGAKLIGAQSPQELIGKPILDVVHPDSRSKVVDLLLHVAEGKVAPLLEEKFVKFDGSVIDVEVVGIPYLYRGQIATQVVVRDITECKQAETNLKQALDWQQAIFEGSRDAIFISDQDSRFVAVNNAACDLTGYSREQLLKMRIPDIHDLPDLDAYKMYHQRIFGGEEILSEAKILRSDSAKIDTEFNNRCVSIAGKLYMHTTARNITERKRAEETLWESVEKYRTLVETADDTILLTDLKGRHLFRNSAYYTSLGYEVGDEVSLDGFSIVHPDDLPLMRSGVSKLLEEGTLTNEYRVRHKNGNWIYRFAKTRVIYDDAHQPKSLLSIIRDITERKQVEEMLHKSELRYRNLIEQAPDTIFIVDAEGNLLHVNQAGKKMLGYSEDELCKMNTVDTYPTDEMTVGSRRLIEMLALSAGETMHFERLMRRKDGTLFPVEISVGALEDGNTHAIIRDITERKQSEGALHKSEQRFRNITEQVTDVIFMTNNRGHIIYISPSTRSVFGYSQEEMISIPFVKFLVKSEAPRAMTEFNLSMRSGKKRKNLTFHMKHKDGSTFTGELTANAFYENDLVTGIIGVIRNITERLQAEEEIRKSKKLLEELHKHLYEIRENERALISREIHDQIGQSLTALKLDLNRIQDYVSTNTEAMVKLEGMIELISNTIKDVQRISSDLRPGILDDLGLASAIEWYCGEFEERTGIRCSLKLDDSIFGDSQKNLVFFRVLQEALTNVIRHANASSVTIKLHQTQKGTTLAIMDNGIGITREKVESTKSLGLIGMRERVRQFGGKVDISPGKGKGTKLTIFIPEKKKSE